LRVSKSSVNNTTPDNDGPSKSLYQRFLAFREDVLRHKWLKSEEAGEDVGFEAALIDWLESHKGEGKTASSAK